MNKTITLLAILISVSIVAQSQPYHKFGVDTLQGNIPKGLAISDIAPDFTAKDQSKQQVNLYSLLNDNKVVLFFYRGNWCPYCNMYLKNLKDSIGFILDKGAKVIAVSPESYDNITKTSDKYDIDLLLIQDSKDEIANAYDVLFQVTKKYQKMIKMGLFTDIARHNDSEQARLPVPATYVIDINKTIIYKHFDINYKERAPIIEILKVL